MSLQIVDAQRLGPFSLGAVCGFTSALI